MDDKRDRARRARGEPAEAPEEQPRHFYPTPPAIQEAAIAEYRLSNAALTEERLRAQSRRDALAEKAQANLTPANSVIEQVQWSTAKREPYLPGEQSSASAGPAMYNIGSDSGRRPGARLPVFDNEQDLDGMGQGFRFRVRVGLGLGLGD